MIFRYRNVLNPLHRLDSPGAWKAQNLGQPRGVAPTEALALWPASETVPVGAGRECLPLLQGTLPWMCTAYAKNVPIELVEGQKDHDS